MTLRTSVAVVAGVGLGLSFEPVGLSILLPLGVAAFFCVVRGVSAGRGAVLGLLFGLAYMLTVWSWIRVMGIDAWIALSTFEALSVALLGAGLALVSRLRAWPVLMPVLWVAMEVVFGAWPVGGLTWGRIAFATADTPYADWLPWVGSNGVSLVVALSAGLLAWLAVWTVESRGSVARGGGELARRVAVLTGAAVLLCVPMLTIWSGGTAGELTVAVVQGDVPGNGNELVAHHREVTQSHVDLTHDLARDVDAGSVPQPDLVIWPENTTAVDPFTNDNIRQDIEASVRAVRAPVLLGGIVDAPREDQVLNQGIVVSPETGPGDRYTKRHPVPFGEYIPYRDIFGNWAFERLDLVPRDMISGTRKEPLSVDGTRIADLICFDVAYDDTLVDQVTRGAGAVVVQTSNALFIHTGQIEQQYEMSRLRALETGRYVVVASVNGLSGVIAPDGDPVAEIEPRTRDVLVREITLTDGVPPSMWVGPWLGRASVMVGVVVVALCLFPYRRTATAEQVRSLDGAATGGGRE